MLVLSRRAGEAIVVGDDVTVTVLEVRGDIVRAGIDAPSESAVESPAEVIRRRRR